MALVAAVALSQSAVAENESESRLPDGTQFVFWEQPLTFTKTYYVDGSHPRANDRGPGTQSRPFRTISKAAEVLQPGERVVIAAGVYREFVQPARGGTGPDKMISYEAAPGAQVIIKGSEELNEGWEVSDSPLRNAPPAKIWKQKLPASLFKDLYNPFAMVLVPSDWSWLDTKRVDMGPYFRRRGLVFVDGQPLEPVEQYRELGNIPLFQPLTPEEQAARLSGLPTRMRGGPIMQEIGGSPDGRFWVEHQGNVVHIRVPKGDIGDSRIELAVREQVFAPRQSGLGYIRLKGLTFQHAANAFPPPQRGLVSTVGGHHWIIEGNTFEWANGVGLDIGRQFSSGAPSPQAGEAHVVRGNVFRYLGVEGIGGMGTTNALIEDNLIEWVGWQDAERAWEAAGAKFHFARNMLFRRNVVRHIRHANGLWLDVGNTNSRITNNVFADIVSVSAAIHMEMSVEQNQIDNNIIWDVRNSEPGTPGQRGAAGSGIFLHASEKQIVANNLIGRCDNVGVFPALRPDRRGSGNARQHKIYNNVFVDCANGGIVFAHTDNEADGNVYASQLSRVGALGDPLTPEALDWQAWRERGWDRNGAHTALEASLDTKSLRLTLKGIDAIEAVPVFNAIDNDFSGQHTADSRLPGPFASPDSSPRNVDPRRHH
jgi:hypothetical protein